ncbi:MAG: type II secretion system F family protein [Phycisphaerales bacterium]|nr:type II secretion system F family protein [Phycisphaerales bacterium]
MLAAIESSENALHKWNYKARKAGGELSRGVLEALTHSDAVRELRRQGLAILEVSLGDSSASVGEAVSAKSRKRRLENAFRKDDTVSFCSQIAVMLRTGVTLKESLDTFAEQASRPVVGELARTIRDDVCEGEDFSSALAKWPKIFPSLMISLVRAAEASGMLDEMMARVAKDLAKQRKTSRQVKGAMAYPAIMLIVAVLAVTIILTAVMPRFAPLFAIQGDKLPLPTKLLLGLSDFIRFGWMYWAPGMVAIGFAIWFWMKSAMGRQVIDKAKLTFPVVGPMFRHLYVSRFSSTMATLLSAGVPLLDVVHILKDVTSNLCYDAMWKLIEERVSHGGELAPTFREFKFVPRNVAAIIAAGEKSGRLPEVLQSAAQVAEEDLEVSLKSATSMVEPILIVVMGVVVGGIASAMLMPIFNMSKMIGPH